MKRLLGFRPHLICSLSMFVFISIMVIEKTQAVRAMLLVPIIVFFLAFEILYGMELTSAARKKNGRE